MNTDLQTVHTVNGFELSFNLIMFPYSVFKYKVSNSNVSKLTIEPKKAKVPTGHPFYP